MTGQVPYDPATSEEDPGLLAMSERSVLLTGATGFVGGAVRPALAREGWRVRCLTRDAARARARSPRSTGSQGDVADPASCARALDGCQAALYLVHGIGEGADYRRREVEAAHDLLAGGGRGGRGTNRVSRRRRAGRRRLRAPAQPARRGRGAARRPGQDHRAAREHDRRARQPELAHRARSGGPPAGHGPAAVAEVAHAAGRDRRRRRRAGAGARAAARGQRVVRHAWTGHAVREGDPARRPRGSWACAHPRMLEVPLLSPRLSSLWVRFVTRASGRWRAKSSSA